MTLAEKSSLLSSQCIEEPIPLDSFNLSEFSDQEKQDLSFLFNFNGENQMDRHSPDVLNTREFNHEDQISRNVPSIPDLKKLPIQENGYIGEGHPSSENFKSVYGSDNYTFKACDKQHSYNIVPQDKKQRGSAFSFWGPVSSSDPTPAKVVSNSCVTDVDVLFGRGKRSNNHVGNLYFRMVVSNMANKYKTCAKLEKTALACDIVKIIHAKGGRFLSPTPDPELWVEVTGQVLRRKTSQALRDSFSRMLKINPPVMEVIRGMC